jgi:hypothetical protein
MFRWSFKKRAPKPPAPLYLSEWEFTEALCEAARREYQRQISRQMPPYVRVVVAGDALITLADRPPFPDVEGRPVIWR